MCSLAFSRCASSQAFSNATCALSLKSVETRIVLMLITEPPGILPVFAHQPREDREGGKDIAALEGHGDGQADPGKVACRDQQLALMRQRFDLLDVHRQPRGQANRQAVV